MWANSWVALGNVAHAEVVSRKLRIKTLCNNDLPLIVDADRRPRLANSWHRHQHFTVPAAFG